MLDPRPGRAESECISGGSPQGSAPWRRPKARVWSAVSSAYALPELQGGRRAQVCADRNITTIVIMLEAVKTRTSKARYLSGSFLFPVLSCTNVGLTVGRGPAPQQGGAKTLSSSSDFTAHAAPRLSVIRHFPVAPGTRRALSPLCLSHDALLPLGVPVPASPSHLWPRRAAQPSVPAFIWHYVVFDTHGCLSPARRSRRDVSGWCRAQCLAPHPAVPLGFLRLRG